MDEEKSPTIFEHGKSSFEIHSEQLRQYSLTCMSGLSTFLAEITIRRLSTLAALALALGMLPPVYGVDLIFRVCALLLLFFPKCLSHSLIFHLYNWFEIGAIACCYASHDYEQSEMAWPVK